MKNYFYELQGFIYMIFYNTTQSLSKEKKNTDADAFFS